MIRHIEPMRSADRPERPTPSVSEPSRLPVGMPSASSKLPDSWRNRLARLLRSLAVLLVLTMPNLSGATEVYMTGIDLHTLGRLVFGELKKSSYEIPDELAQAKTVSVRWLEVDKHDPVKRYRQLVEQVGYTVEFADGIYRVVPRVAKSEVYTSKNRTLTDIVDMLAGFPGVSVASSSKSVPGAKSEKTGDLVKASSDRSLESVVISGFPDRLRAWKDAAKALDVVPESVQVRAAVFEVSLSKSEGSAVSLAGSLLPSVSKEASIGAQTSQGAFSLGVGGLTLTVSSLLSDQRFRLLSQPYLSVLSGRTARLAVGQKLPILSETSVSDSGRETQSVKYVDAGVVFDVTPTKWGDLWEVVIAQELSSVQSASGVAGNPIFSNRSVSSRLRAKQGEVIVLAGLDSVERSADRGKVGFFDLFGSSSTSQSRTQILLLIELESAAPDIVAQAKIEQQKREIESAELAAAE